MQGAPRIVVGIIAAACVAGAAFAAACTSPYASSPEAAAAPESSSPDAAPESSSPDAADGGRFCEHLSPAPTFCRDFDDGAPLFFQFGSHFTTDGGTIDFDTSTSASSPASLRVAVPAGALVLGSTPGIFYASSYVTRDLTVAATATVRFAFQLRVDDAAMTGSITARAAALTFSQPDGRSFNLYLQLNANSTVLEEQENPGDGGAYVTRNHSLGTPIAIGVWTAVAITITLGSAPAIAVTLDGFDALPGTILVAPKLFDGVVGFDLESTYYAGSAITVPATTMHFDDVVVDVR